MSGRRTRSVLMIAIGALMTFAASNWSAAADLTMPAAGCVSLQAHGESAGPDGDYWRLPMHRIAERTEEDPSGLWTRYELWNPNNPRKTDIWEGAITLCEGGRIIVSQIMNRQCSSQAVCPMRIVREDDNGERAQVISYKQACTDYDTFMLRKNANQLLACNQPYDWH